MKYDIFISYRRKDSSGRSNVPTARQFKLAFEAPPYNYKVFFDYSECTDNYFSDTILPAIRTCDFFVLVLTKDCLARCVNEGDWVRREIEEAIAYNRKIIPITPDKECETFPSDLPDLLRITFKDLQITTVYTDHMFESSIDFLVKNRFHLNKALTDSEAERKAKESAERERKAEEDRRKAEEEAERARLEKERIEREETERKAKEVAEKERLEREKKTEQASSIINGHEYVDLGLPSGTLWATCNIGASAPEDFGDYFAWGEGNKATANWGSGWCLPTKGQWEELMRNTNSTWVTRKGVNGRLFMANNGNSLFLPAAGARGNLYCAGYAGDYWSSSLRTGTPYDAWDFRFASDYYYVHSSNRYSFYESVRAVRSAE